ncbi:MAG: flap endonuclease-1 [Candidatus Wukongarchaeota archaeon]|nr:flap endonuclease-1 [Candidatus Wukongarchaeota archaeon]
MGVKLGPIVSAVEIGFEDLRGKVVAIDGYNALYQFLSIIRQPDGTPLKDSKGRITSHLSGVFYRMVNVLEEGVLPVFVFDGVPPEIKAAEVERRKEKRTEAAEKYEEALEAGDMEQAFVYATQATSLRKEMVEGAKHLLDLLGIPSVMAPSEGEAQAAHMAIKGDVWAVVSQDFDSLLHGAPRMVRNLTISGKRKLPRKKQYIVVKPELLELEKVLSELEITQEQLIDIGILLGTDFNPEGVKGVGPKTALKLIKEHGSLEEALKHLDKEVFFPVKPEKIRKWFLKPEITDNYVLEKHEPDFEGTIDFLCNERDFSKDRVSKALKKLTQRKKAIDEEEKKKKQQTSLDVFFQ